MRKDKNIKQSYKPYVEYIMIDSKWSTRKSVRTETNFASSTRIVPIHTERYSMTVFRLKATTENNTTL